MDAVDRIGMVPDGVPWPLTSKARAEQDASAVSQPTLAHAPSRPAPRPPPTRSTPSPNCGSPSGRARTPCAPVYAKGRHFEDCAKHVDRWMDIDLVDKRTIVNWKNALLAGGQIAKTADNKLMSIHDMFEYAIANGLYSASPLNPVKGVFILDKAQRKAKTDSYQPFTEEDIAKLFEPEAYKAGMSEPDFYWGPLLDLFTGMRISEATAIRCKDVKTVAGGVPHIFVPKSKTTAGVRNVAHPQCVDPAGVSGLRGPSRPPRATTASFRPRLRAGAAEARGGRQSPQMAHRYGSSSGRLLQKRRGNSLVAPLWPRQHADLRAPVDRKRIPLLGHAAGE